MPIKKYRPMTNGQRHKTSLDYRATITKSEPEKSLVKSLKKSGGRNSRGLITAQGRGGGAKKKYRIIDFRRNKDDITAKVAAIEYDPLRSANIALLHYADGEKRYILAPAGIQVGQHVMSGAKTEPEVGNCMPLETIPLGMQIHNIEINPGQGGKIARSAGQEATLMAREGEYAVILMPSGEMRRILKRCRATIGVVGNSDHGMVKIGKAGRKRHMGRRPHVRGSTKNPVDHPLGGGEGRRAGGRHFCSPTGVYARGGKTRSRTARSNNLIISRRKKK